jgi:hypothetical protein
MERVCVSRKEKQIMLTQLTRGVCGANSRAKNRGFLAEFAVLLAAAIFSFFLAGYDNPAGGEEGGIDSVLVARWYLTQASANNKETLCSRSRSTADLSATQARGTTSSRSPSPH